MGKRKKGLYYDYTGYPNYNVQEENTNYYGANVYDTGGFGNFFGSIGRFVAHPFNRDARLAARSERTMNNYLADNPMGDDGSYNPQFAVNDTGNTINWGSAPAGTSSITASPQTNVAVTNPNVTAAGTVVQSSLGGVGSDSKGKTVDFGNNGGDTKDSESGGSGVPWGAVIGAAGTNIANAFLDTEASTADRVAGALGIPALANQWRADTTKGDAFLKSAQANLDAYKKNNYIQDASSTSGASNAVKLNNQQSVMPIMQSAPNLSWKDFKGNWWRNTGASMAQGAASGSVGGPWGALGGAVTGLLGSVGGLFGRNKRAKAAYEDFQHKWATVQSAQQAAYKQALTNQTLSNMQALANGNTQQRISDMSNIRAYGGNLYPIGGGLTLKSDVDKERELATNTYEEPEYPPLTAEDLARARQDARHPNRLTDTFLGKPTGELSDNAATWENFVPIVGTINDWDEYFADPTAGNLGWAILGTATDILPFGKIIKPLAKGVRNSYKATKVAKQMERALDKANDLNNFPEVRAALKELQTAMPEANYRTAITAAGSEAEKKAARNAYMRHQLEESGKAALKEFNPKKNPWIFADLGANAAQLAIGGGDAYIPDERKIISNTGAVFTHNPSSRSWISEDTGPNGERIIVTEEEMYDNLQKGLGKIIDTKAFGGNLYPDGGIINPIDDTIDGGELPEITVNAKSMPWYEKAWRKGSRFVNNNIISPTLGRAQYAWNYLNSKLADDDDSSYFLDLSNKDVKRVQENNQYNVDAILANDFVETDNPNSLRKKADFTNTSDTLIGDMNIPLKHISTYYGVEDGKLKAGTLDSFKENTLIAPNRASNIGKIKEWHPSSLIDETYKHNPIARWGAEKLGDLLSSSFVDNYVTNKIMESLSDDDINFLKESLLENDGIENPTQEDLKTAAILYTDLIDSNPLQQKISDYRTRLYDYADEKNPAKVIRGFAVNENNDTIPDYKFNTYPKGVFADENGNAVFFSGLTEENDRLINEYLKKHPSYPVMLDNGRFSHYTTNNDLNAYSGGMIDPNETMVIGINNNTKAMGGNLYTDLSPNMMSMWSNKQEIDRQKVMNQQMNFGLGNSFNQKFNTFADGGQLSTDDLPNNMQYYANGGTHEENPYGGIQVGVDQQGNPNLTEAGEFRYGDFVFSDRINVDPELLLSFNLSPYTKRQNKKAAKGKLSYADMAKKYANKNKELMDDPITKNSVDAFMQRAANAQEYQKTKEAKEAALAKEMNDYKTALNKQHNNPTYGNMKYNGMGNAATQQGVNAGVDAGMGNPMSNADLSNVNRSGNAMMAAYGGNLYWGGGPLSYENKKTLSVLLGIDYDEVPSWIDQDVYNDLMENPDYWKESKGKNPFNYGMKGVGGRTLKYRPSKILNMLKDKHPHYFEGEEPHYSLEDRLTYPDAFEPERPQYLLDAAYNMGVTQGSPFELPNEYFNNVANEYISDQYKKNHPNPYTFSRPDIPQTGITSVPLEAGENAKIPNNIQGIVPVQQQALNNNVPVYQNNFGLNMDTRPSDIRNKNPRSVAPAVSTYTFSKNGVKYPAFGNLQDYANKGVNVNNTTLYPNGLASLNSKQNTDINYIPQFPSGTANTDTDNTNTGTTGTVNTNTGTSGTANTGTANTGTGTTGNTLNGTYAESYIKEDPKEYPLYNTNGLWAQTGKGIMPLVYDWANKTNVKYDPNDRGANRLEALAATGPVLRTADTIGGYRAPNLMDVERENNAATAQGLAQLQGMFNVANGNRGFVGAQSAQNSYNTGMSIGKNYMTTQQYNDTNRLETDKFNNTIDIANQNARNSMYQDNQKYGESQIQRAVDGLQKAEALRQYERIYADKVNDERMNNRASNMGAFADNYLNFIYDRAYENKLLNAKNADITNPYYTDRDGKVHYVGDSGLYSFVNSEFAKNKVGGKALTNGHFTGDELTEFSDLQKTYSAKDLATKPELQKMIRSLVNREVEKRQKEYDDDQTKLAQDYEDNYNRYQDLLGNASAMQGYGDEYFDKNTYDFYANKYAGKSFDQLTDAEKRALAQDISSLDSWITRSQNAYYNRPRREQQPNTSAYGGPIRRKSKSNKNEPYRYMNIC